jgi:DNA-binding protein H-NS
MNKLDGFEKKSFSELAELRDHIDHLMIERQANSRTELREKMASMAKARGLTLDDVFGKHGRAKGSVAAKYRDPKHPENTWTGRGRMPRWMVAATKGGKVRKEDFLI